MSRKIFSCGTQFVDWQNRNCCECNKFNYNTTKIKETCDIEWHMAVASISDGIMDQKYIDRIGGFQNGSLVNCQEKNREKIHEDQIMFEGVNNE